MIEWGAKTIPEGGYQALPSQFSGKRVLMIGDCVGFVKRTQFKRNSLFHDVGNLCGPKTIFQAFKEKDFSDI